MTFLGLKTKLIAESPSEGEGMGIIIGFINNQSVCAVVLSNCWFITLAGVVFCHVACFIYFALGVGYSLFSMLQILITNSVLIMYVSFIFERTLKT